MGTQEIDAIISLIKKEVIPAVGCTEPIAVALCAAKAREILEEIPEKITVYLSANVLKNAMGVGIPGTDGMVGLPIAVALGALIGKSEYRLEVLKNTTPEAVETGRKMIENKTIGIRLKEHTEEKLYIEVHCRSGQNSSKAIIAQNHTQFVHLSKNEHVLLDKTYEKTEESRDEQLTFTLRKIYEFTTVTPIEKLRFILDAAKINKQAAEISLSRNYGHGLGSMLNNCLTNNIMGNNIYTKILSYTSAACDARMAGAMIPIASNSGSGNQGITATLPVIIYAESTGKSEDELIRALILSNLTVIHIKQHLGRLSALCGCIIAATGSSCGLVYLMGGNFDQICYAVKNMVANLTGMICDGAKPSCSLKLTSGVSTAVFSAMMALQNKYVKSVEGIIDDDVDKSIKNLTLIGARGMTETDKIILDIMTHKD
ncbi:MAG: L-serine ammonia-lyase, iron-sulfur-dependent, subunit alpha [Prevotellaceae bacterium]|jgi:L-cysteine desulfidase|nr:L-serine ammonia-lyase, iron-sulfur-dependent, subunit alpha [Prevotellaceae bacterium]